MTPIPTIYEIQRGEDIMLELDAMTGNVMDVAIVAAKMRALPDGEYELADEAVPVAATFTVTARAASGVIDTPEYIPAGWSLRVGYAICETLAAGHYLVDALVDYTTHRQITDVPVIVRIREGGIVSLGAGVP